MHKTTVMLSKELKASLQEIARRQDMSLAAVIREALELYLRLDRFPKSIGMVADGSFDASKDEEYLAEYWVPYLLEECDLPAEDRSLREASID